MLPLLRQLRGVEHSQAFKRNKTYLKQILANMILTIIRKISQINGGRGGLINKRWKIIV